MENKTVKCGKLSISNANPFTLILMPPPYDKLYCVVAQLSNAGEIYAPVETIFIVSLLSDVIDAHPLCVVN